MHDLPVRHNVVFVNVPLPFNTEGARAVYDASEPPLAILQPSYKNDCEEKNGIGHVFTIRYDEAGSVDRDSATSRRLGHASRVFGACVTRPQESKQVKHGDKRFCRTGQRFYLSSAF